MTAAEFTEHLCELGGERLMEHAEHLILCAGRIGQRPEQVEQRAHAEFAAYRCGVLHRAVMIGRKHETDADAVHALGNLFGGEAHIHAELFQHVRAAAATSALAVEMLKVCMLSPPVPQVSIR